jgi:hypothetical protein
MKKRSVLKTLLAMTLVCVSVAFAGEGAAVKGNPNSKVYHKAACKHYTAKGSTAGFKGYKGCKQCCKPTATDKKSTKKK